MNLIETRRAVRQDFILAAVLVAGGLVVVGISLMQISTRQSVQRHEFAQVIQPAQDKPSIAPGKDGGTPAESMPGGARPTTPAPEPARPDADAQKAGAAPALPPAPAEKIGEPVSK